MPKTKFQGSSNPENSNGNNRERSTAITFETLGFGIRLSFGFCPLELLLPVLRLIPVASQPGRSLR
jgi:hypothetical protein